MCLHFLVHFDEGFGKTVLYKHKSKLGAGKRAPLPQILADGHPDGKHQHHHQPAQKLQQADRQPEPAPHTAAEHHPAGFGGAQGIEGEFPEGGKTQQDGEGLLPVQPGGGQQVAAPEDQVPDAGRRKGA